MIKAPRVYACLVLYLALSGTCRGQGAFDSLQGKMPRHYFRTVIGLDLYRKPEVSLDTSSKIGRKLGSFGMRQVYLSFSTPLVTKVFTGTDSSIKNTHLLLTGNFFSLRPVFGSLDRQHRLTRNSIGIRYIYNTGKKTVWFIDVSPFVTRDATYRSRGVLRMASTLLCSVNESPTFNWRFGITKSFIWGNRYYLPFIGLRVGRLDRVHFSLQFPRSLNLTIPAGPQLVFSLYSRPQGGVFYFSNQDSLYFRSGERGFHFTRYEICTGLRADVRLGDHFAFYISSGISSANNLFFFGNEANKAQRVSRYLSYFYRASLPGTLFINAGVVLTFGRTRSYFNDRNLYDATDLNAMVDNTGNPQLPLRPRKLRSDYNLESIEDLVEYAE
jgi:hypothetical protein